ncbi:hypothetical protein B0H10DRAFT_2129158 [Mycena sp. CBHHK59/15]|nr:hypothetical protein B0H10DRAFT_2129158 [Mycena sp. CBHHK59/15]
MNRSTFRKLPPTTEVSIIDQLSKELASAFSKDPLARAILGEWPSIFRLHLLSGLEDGNVFVVGETSSVEGVAVVFGVGKDMNMESPEWQAFLNNLPSKNQEWYTSFNLQYRDFVGRAYGCDHQLKSLYLLLLGVRPSSQEKGLGTELFRGVQARAEDLDVDLCWQTTTAPEFYRKLGFKAISDTIYGNEQGNVRQWAYLDKKII